MCCCGVSVMWVILWRVCNDGFFEVWCDLGLFCCEFVVWFDDYVGCVFVCIGCLCVGMF